MLRVRKTWNSGVRILVGAIVAIVLAASHGTAEEELDEDEILNLIGYIGSGDFDAEDSAYSMLGSVRSKEGIEVLLAYWDEADRVKKGEIARIISAIGEPAFEVAWESYPSEAFSLLADEIGPGAIPFFMGKLKAAEVEEREYVAWALYRIISQHGEGQNDLSDLIPVLIEEANASNELTKRLLVAAVCVMEDDSAIPAMTQYLSDETVCDMACGGLIPFGARASQAIPALRRGIAEGTLPAVAFHTLAVIEGEKAVPFLVERLATWELDPDDRSDMARAFGTHPHPLAIPFMEEWLEADDPSPRMDAVRFFAALDHPTALKHMRNCLAADPDTDEDSVERRQIAVDYLVDHGDTPSYDTIAVMMREDPSVQMRVTAVKALGRSGWGTAVSHLKGCIEAPDEGYNDRKYREGAVHNAAVNALASIGTPEAYDVLYEGILESRAKEDCSWFWRLEEDRAVFDAFLARFARKPTDEQEVIDILSKKLWDHRWHYRLGEEASREARDEFLAHIRDPEHFGKDTPPKAGDATEGVHFRFYTIDFAKVRFSLPEEDPQAEDQEYVMLYRKHQGTWIPMGKTIRHEPKRDVIDLSLADLPRLSEPCKEWQRALGTKWNHGHVDLWPGAQWFGSTSDVTLMGQNFSSITIHRQESELESAVRSIVLEFDPRDDDPSNETVDEGREKWFRRTADAVYGASPSEEAREGKVLILKYGEKGEARLSAQRIAFSPK